VIFFAILKISFVVLKRFIICLLRFATEYRRAQIIHRFFAKRYLKDFYRFFHIIKNRKTIFS